LTHLEISTLQSPEGLIVHRTHVEVDYLGVPAFEKQFLISPPSSPPLGFVKIFGLESKVEHVHTSRIVPHFTVIFIYKMGFQFGFELLQSRMVDWYETDKRFTFEVKIRVTKHKIKRRISNVLFSDNFSQALVAQKMLELSWRLS
jgi:hypothetical protein